MKKHCLSALTLVCALAGSASLGHAQAVATATGNALSVGIAYQNADPDYGPSRSSGLGVYANFDFSRYLGLTAEVNAPTALSNIIFPERSFFAGARGEYHHGRYMAYFKLMGGIAASGNNSSVDPQIQSSQLINASQTYGAYAYGGGVEYRLDMPVTVRLDYEQQSWLSYEPNGLTPSIFSVGAAYRFH